MSVNQRSGGPGILCVAGSPEHWINKTCKIQNNLSLTTTNQKKENLKSHNFGAYGSWSTAIRRSDSLAFYMLVTPLLLLLLYKTQMYSPFRK